MKEIRKVVFRMNSSGKVVVFLPMLKTTVGSIAAMNEEGKLFELPLCYYSECKPTTIPDGFIDMINSIYPQSKFRLKCGSYLYFKDVLKYAWGVENWEEDTRSLHITYIDGSNPYIAMNQTEAAFKRELFWQQRHNYAIIDEIMVV